MTTTMHPTEAMLLRAVCETPSDDLPRLVLADWWQENGQADRGEFVKVQVDLTSGPSRCLHLQRCLHRGPYSGIEPHPMIPVSGPTVDCGYCRSCQLRRRQDGLWSDLGIGDSFDMFGLKSRMLWENCSGEVGICLVHRGFVCEVRCTATAFLANGPRVAMCQPVESVSFPDKNPLSDIGVDSYFARELFGLPTRYHWIPNDSPLATEWMVPTEWAAAGLVMIHDSEEAATRELERVALVWARRKAGLPT